MALKIFHTIDQLCEFVTQNKKSNSIGFVPTMGNLHQGHIDLVDRAREKSDIVIVSIFVNPMQFGAGEDLDNYPRTFEEDCRKLEAAGADVLFAPEAKEIYGEGEGESRTRVVVPGLSNILCGASRPGHFDGVTTIVTKLFNLVQPDMAVFGEKDFQQLAIIRKMVKELNMPVEIIGVPIRRETDGLAMSSRNGYLTVEQRKIAPGLQRSLQALKARILESETPDFLSLADAATQDLNATGFKTDYIEIRRQQDLQPAESGDKELVVLAAAFLGSTRLIDNLVIDR